ncbi:MAG: hypothetical protein NVSMB27_17100 [Ktedonobacteraceae bacterium]
MSLLDQKTRLAQWMQACATHVCFKLLKTVAFAGTTILLLRLSGGFPPTAWLFLLQVIPTVPRLWHLRGAAVLLPIGGLAALDGTLVVAWILLVRVGWMVARSWKVAQRVQALPSPMTITSAGQEQAAEKRVQPLIALGDEPGKVPVPREDSSGEDKLASSTTPPLASTHRFAHRTSEEGMPESVLVQQLPEAAGAAMQVGSCIHLVQNQPWKEDGIFIAQGNLTAASRTLPYGLFVVVDGSGGQRLAGHEACQLAIEAVTGCILQIFSETEAAAWDEHKLMEVVIEGMKAANQALYTCNQEHHAYMEVSMAVCLVVNEVAYAASFGETRLYLYCDSTGLLKKTCDDVGGMKAQCLGERTEVKFASFTCKLQQGDGVLLCTDGLWKAVRGPDIEEIMHVSASNPTQVCKTLVQTARECDREDHIGVVIAQLNKVSTSLEITEKVSSMLPAAHLTQ